MSAVANRVYERWIDSGDGLTFDEWRVERKRRAEESRRQARFYAENADRFHVMQQANANAGAFWVLQQAGLVNLRNAPGVPIPVGGALGGLFRGGLI